MCEYTSINKNQAVTTDICYIDKTIDKLLLNGQTKIALEYIDEIMEINNNSCSINTQLLEKLNFTKERINKLNAKTKLQSTYNVYDINSVIEYIYNNNLTCKDKKPIIESILTHNESLMHKFVKCKEAYNIIKYIPSEYITKDIIVKYLEMNVNNIFKINIPSTLSDDDYIEIMYTIYCNYLHSYDEANDRLLWDYMKKLYVFTNKNIITKFFDKLEINYKKRRTYIQCYFFDFYSIEDSIYDSDNDNNNSYDWLTSDIILRAVKLGQDVMFLPEHHVTKETVLAYLKFNNGHRSTDCIKNKWLTDMSFVDEVLQYTREIICKLKLTDEQIINLIVSYKDTIKYLPDINYDMCYKAYKIHGDSCVIYMPYNIRKLFK